ncbi:MAG TPA: DUF3842 family protein [Candidatus Eisenbergiella pullistercoris]|uniref:DUF3842 family protein n=1 Tax=Candidatus Eisenbergiella pullistercoris TaxID=2838555 RepID=A0A9D1YMZ5_9FIRM|nr:DUF3842 family protein [Candidatus Eisenbergiella pullistercoris]
MKIVVMDGQGGRMGALLCEKLKKNWKELPDGTLLTAIGTNSAATAAMLKAGADCGATGENPVLVACRDADFIIGPLGIIAADSLMGEVTPAMAVAVGSSPAQKILLPVNRCNHHVVGVQDYSMSRLTDEAVQELIGCLKVR